MSYDETFVGSLAVIFAILATAIALGPWTRPYQLRTISAVANRFGKPAARGLWIAIAIALTTAGWAILTGMRPSYAKPAQQSQVDH